MTKLYAAAAAIMMASPAMANFVVPPPTVPEIDALAGVAAIAAVGAVVALVRERSKH